MKRCIAIVFFMALILGAFPGLSNAEIEQPDTLPAVISDGDKAALQRERAKLDELRKGLLDDIAQQNTECGHVAESDTFRIDLCRDRQGFIMGRIQSYKKQLGEYREKIQKAIFMAPQGKAAVQSGLVFKDIPAPVAAETPAGTKGQMAASSAADFQRMMEYFNDPENNPRVKRAKEDADRFHDMHVTVSQSFLGEANRTISRVRAETVIKDPTLGREDVDRIVSQHPDVKKITAAWLLMHDQTKRMADDREEDYASIVSKMTEESQKKR